MDARTVLAHGHDRLRCAGAHRIGERLPVESAIVTADEQRDAPVAIDVERGETRVRGRTDRIVDPQHAIAHAQRLQAMRERHEVRGRTCQRQGVDAEGLDRGQHGAKIAAVVPARQRQSGRVHHGGGAAMQDVAAQVPTVGRAEPADLTPRQRQRGQARVIRIEHRDAWPRARDQRQLVLDVLRLAAVPVQVLGEDVGDHRDVGPYTAGRDIAGLVTRQFDRPGVRLRIEQLQQGQPDVAGQRRAQAMRAQQMGQQRGGGALALGAGDADRAGRDLTRRGASGEPQRGAADEARALRGGRHRLGPVRTDPG